PPESYVIVEEGPLSPGFRAGSDPQMLERSTCRDTSPGGAAQHPDAHEEGLDDRLDRVGFLAHTHRERAEADGSAVEALDDRREDGAVESVEADRIDVVQFEGAVDRAHVGSPAAPAPRLGRAVHESVVAHPA